MDFSITITGTISEEAARRLWHDHIKPVGANIIVLPGESFIFGNNDDETINRLAFEAGKTGCLVEVERG